MPRVIIDFEYSEQPTSDLVIGVQDALHMASIDGYKFPAYNIHEVAYRMGESVEKNIWLHDNDK